MHCRSVKSLVAVGDLFRQVAVSELSTRSGIHATLFHRRLQLRNFSQPVVVHVIRDFRAAMVLMIINDGCDT